jgi:hypothetical protein
MGWVGEMVFTFTRTSSSLDLLSTDPTQSYRMRLLRIFFSLIASISALANRLQNPLLSPYRFGANEESARTNANSIFNAIHSSMRQWGSSLNHNGMSFFLASIPPGVMLYHGTHTPDRVRGIEWLAFEIEHAENFANARSPRRPGQPGRGPPGDRPPAGGGGPPGGSTPFEDNDPRSFDSEEPQSGYLHMYRTNRLSRLLYIDGMSAGKTKLGTLDSQDILLLNFTSGMFGERERAAKLCDWGKKHGIEGYIRTEAGFEIIWCEFQHGLDFVSHNQRPIYDSLENDNAVGLLEYYRAMSARYDGITASRVSIDYSSMISAFFYPLNLTDPDTNQNNCDHPRLLSATDDELRIVKHDLEVLLDTQAISSVDWQGIVDMIVTRYNTRLPFLATKATKVEFRSEINTLLNTFIDYNFTSIDSAISQCMRHYVRAADSKTTQDFLILAALEEVSGKICETLFQARNLVLSDDSEDPPPEAVKSLKELILWLDWTDWKKCGACAFDEVCVVAMWPYGTVEDHNRPSCQNSSQVASGKNRYWNRQGSRDDRM